MSTTPDDPTKDLPPSDDRGAGSTDRWLKAVAPSRRAAGQRVSGYELISRLDKDGGNAFGEVWLAKRLEPFQRVAIKFLRPDRVSEELILRFSRAESKALARFNHPYIARFYAFGFDGETPFLVMQYVPGDQINSYCDRHCLTIPDRLRLMARVCDAVQHVHLQGVIHRDLKPGNILVSEAKPDALAEDGAGAGDREPIPVLIDFGLAKSTNPDAPISSQLVSRLGMFAGTYAYASPEQFTARRGEDTGRGADIYALGAVLFELVVGVSPMAHVLGSKSFSDPERLERLAYDARPSLESAFARLAPSEQERIARERGTTVAAMRRLLRSRLSHLSDRALRPRPQDRFTDARAFALDIANYLQDRDFAEAAAEPRIEKWKRSFRRNKAAYIGAAGAAVALSIGLAIAAFVGLELARQRTEGDAQRARAQYEGRMAAVASAGRAWQEGDMAGLRAGLHRADKLRGDTKPNFAERFLAAEANPGEAVFQRDVNASPAVAISPDGGRVYFCGKSTDESTTVEVWDVNPRRLVRSLKLDGVVWDLRLSGDGSALFASVLGGEAGVKRIDCRDWTTRWIDGLFEVRAVNHRGTLLAGFPTLGASLALLEIQTGKLTPLESEGALVFVPDRDGGEALAIESDSGCALIDPSTGASVGGVSHESIRSVECLGMGPNGLYLLEEADRDTVIWQRDPNDSTRFAEIGRHEGECWIEPLWRSDEHASGDFPLLALVGVDMQVSTGVSWSSKMVAHEGGVASHAVSGDGRWCVTSGNNDCFVRLWRTTDLVQGSRFDFDLRGEGDGFRSAIEFDGERATLLRASPDGGLVELAFQASFGHRRLPRRIPGALLERDPAEGLVVVVRLAHAAGVALVADALSGRVRLFDLGTRNLVWDNQAELSPAARSWHSRCWWDLLLLSRRPDEWREGFLPLCHFAIDDRAQIICVADPHERNCALWSVPSEAPKWEVEFPDEVIPVGIALCATEGTVVCETARRVSRDSGVPSLDYRPDELVFLDAVTGTLLSTISLESYQDPAQELLVSPNGRALARRSAEGLLLFDLTADPPAFRAVSVGFEITDFAFSPEGDILAVAGQSGDLALVETVSDTTLLVARVEGGPYAIAFDSSGTSLFVGSPGEGRVLRVADRSQHAFRVDEGLRQRSLARSRLEAVFGRIRDAKEGGATQDQVLSLIEEALADVRSDAKWSREEWLAAEAELAPFLHFDGQDIPGFSDRVRDAVDAVLEQSSEADFELAMLRLGSQPLGHPFQYLQVLSDSRDLHARFARAASVRPAGASDVLVGHRLGRVLEAIFDGMARIDAGPPETSLPYAPLWQHRSLAAELAGDISLAAQYQGMAVRCHRDPRVSSYGRVAFLFRWTSPDDPELPESRLARLEALLKASRESPNAAPASVGPSIPSP